MGHDIEQFDPNWIAKLKHQSCLADFDLRYYLDLSLLFFYFFKPFDQVAYDARIHRLSDLFKRLKSPYLNNMKINLKGTQSTAESDWLFVSFLRLTVRQFYDGYMDLNHYHSNVNMKNLFFCNNWIKGVEIFYSIQTDPQNFFSFFWAIELN